MKCIREIEEEIMNLDNKMEETIDLYLAGIYTDEIYHQLMEKLRGAKNALLWVLK